ncbi:arginine--tRNA ligase [Pontibacillus sp. HN14]|uniref:Arginine--tRNA ligase n=2 Tax=Bacillaceae TaxID=186817 RepID=A0ABY8UYM4_9BACI|nr:MULTISPECIES: arginine--tRNA ligase [Pontibacillus]MCD5323380.1 arginine--tRNA ligase [Pontibacillus sp. HN14]WIF96761.1 arginine--tRNA ligase [Pontibacillus chungwhensis]
MKNVKKEITKALGDELHEYLSLQKIDELLEVPKHENMGDLAFPCFELAKVFRKNPSQIAADLSASIKLSPLVVSTIKAVGPYVNFFYNKEAYTKELMTSVLKSAHTYGSHTFGNEKTIPMDLSSPNIAKPFSMGHLRSTVIGNAVGKILEKCGYNVVRINYLGDWGTQFGKLIAAYTLWGEGEKVRSNPIQELLALYVRFHEEAEKDASLVEMGRAWFVKLEKGDPEAIKLWKWFKEESLLSFKGIYNLLNVSFDSYKGESSHHQQSEEILTLLKEKGLLEESDGALVVRLDEEGLPPALIQKSDGTTLYTTRDLAAAIFRKKTYNHAASLYVVGNEQSLHFKQLRAVLKKMGYDWADEITHVPFGMMLKDGKKMSTRKGKVVFLEEALEKSIQFAKQNIEEKNPGLNQKEDVARKVGVGAVIFHDLKNDRLNDVEFSYEEMLKFEGGTAPYLQYTYARAKSILRKAEGDVTSYSFNAEDWGYAWSVVQKVAAFPEVIEQAAHYYDPSKVAKYLLKLAQSFNAYYANVRILETGSYQNGRLALTEAVAIVIGEGLRLLGVEVPEEM